MEAREVLPTARCEFDSRPELYLTFLYCERVVKKTVPRKITNDRASGILDMSSFLIIDISFHGVLELLSDATG